MSCPWPICPRPDSDESLSSWFERVGHEYRMSPGALLHSMDLAPRPLVRPITRAALECLRDPPIADHVVTLGQLSEIARTTLWPPLTGWELVNSDFRVYCPLCCLQDLGAGKTPYGRRAWLQSWCTICTEHQSPLLVRNLNRRVGARPGWSRSDLKSDLELLAPDRYHELKAPRQPQNRWTVLGSLIEIERAVVGALSGIAPNPLVWGPLAAEEFLRVLHDITTWSLTHFEPVSAWSPAEDLTPLEEQECYGIVGRRRRLLASQYVHGHAQRTLRDVDDPKVRGSALWVAHALMASSHQATRDRQAGLTSQERQAARLLRSAPAGREWLAHRQQHWPSQYRRTWWIDVRPTPFPALQCDDATDTPEINDINC
jgi:hypothetical protein